MSVAVAVRARLLDCAAVTALVGQRVYKDVLPQAVTLPAIRVQRISQGEPFQLRGPIGMNVARVQVDSVASTKASAEAIDAAVAGNGLGPGATGLVGWIGAADDVVILAVLPADVRDGFDPDELRQFRVMRDVMVHYKES